MDVKFHVSLYWLIKHNNLVIVDTILLLANQCCDSICTLNRECHFDEICISGQCSKEKGVAWTCKSGVFTEPSLACEKLVPECIDGTDCSQDIDIKLSNQEKIVSVILISRSTNTRLIILGLYLLSTLY